MKTVKMVLFALVLATVFFVSSWFLFFRECSSYSSATETVPETRCICKGKVFSLDRWLGNEEKLRSGGAKYDRCFGIRTSRYSL